MNAGDTILSAHEALNSSISLTGNNNVANQVLFNSVGLASGSNGTLTMTDTVNNVRTICIATSGRARLLPKGTTVCS